MFGFVMLVVLFKVTYSAGARRLVRDFTLRLHQAKQDVSVGSSPMHITTYANLQSMCWSNHVNNNNPYIIKDLDSDSDSLFNINMYILAT